MRERIVLVLILALAAVGLVYGWKTFWFLTDDAFIAFRYVSNSHLGYGYTWNLPPFPPVEGYTSFLWVVLLDLVWRVTGIEPPVSANWLSLAFAFGSLALTIVMFLRIPLRTPLRSVKHLLLAILLFAILANRTFLAWTSSGLETAMFNFFVLLWVFACLFLPPGGRVWVFSSVSASVLVALTRPDGYLFVAMTLALGTLYVLRLRRAQGLSVASIVVFLPLLVVAAHLFWRKWFYGEWLPNTSIAKFVAPWPESGARYILSFILEYVLWFWLALVALLALKFLRANLPATLRLSLSRLPLSRPLVSLVVVFSLCAHIFYYTVFIGGDHFEYRVYSQLIPLLFLSTIWILNQLPWAPRVVLVVWAMFVLCTLPIPWLHWFESQKLTTRGETYSMKVAVAPLTPSIVRPYAQVFDDLQFWLIDHYVGMRHQEDKLFVEYLLATLPSRAQGMRLSASDHPILAAGAVGVISWVLPTTNIIDTFGLNDPVIAHNPTNLNAMRRMAHDRFPPPGYVECFQPNVQILNAKTLIITARESDPVARITGCINKNWEAPQKDYVDAEEHDPGLDDSLAQALKSLGFENQFYLYRVPHPSPEEDLLLLSAFKQYAGDGCGMISPSTIGKGGTGSDFLLMLLRPAENPPLSELMPFNQAHNFPAVTNVTTSPYDLGYAAETNADLKIIPAVPHPYSFGNGIDLIGYDLPQQELRAGGSVNLTLYLSVVHTPAPANVYVILRPVAGTFNQAALVYKIYNPCRDLILSPSLPAGTSVMLKTKVDLPKETAPELYMLSAGFAQRRNSDRLETLQQIRIMSAP